MKASSIILFSCMVALSVLTGCSTANAPGAAETQQPPERVEVTLTEFAIEATETNFEAGKTYEFVITNEGAIAHEFRIIPPVGQEEDDDGHGDAHGDDTHDTALLVVEEEELAPGASVTVEYTFPEDATD